MRDDAGDFVLTGIYSIKRAAELGTAAGIRFDIRNLEPLPALDLPSNVIAEMPPLLKAYMRLGAKICGEPCWDEDFQVADVFILLKRDELCPRYAKHFKAAV